MVTDVRELVGPRMPKRTAYEHTAQLRHRAEECRTLARLMDTEENAARYLRMADAYDALPSKRSSLRVMS